MAIAGSPNAAKNSNQSIIAREEQAARPPEGPLAEGPSAFSQSVERREVKRTARRGSKPPSTALAEQDFVRAARFARLGAMARALRLRSAVWRPESETGPAMGPNGTPIQLAGNASRP